jgi:polysaccharide biosynthesis/export protein
MKFNRILFLFLIPVYLISCKTQQKAPYYLDNLTDSSGIEEVNVPDLKIQKNDLLSIQVYSLSTMPDVDQLYNLPASGGKEGSGFLVDSYGNIEYPRLGTFHAEGLTKHELAAQIKKRLTEPVELLKEPTVIIRFMNFKITILGQVGKEGVIDVPGERITILQAVGLAGGITDNGKKTDLKVVREVDGKRETGTINLSDKSIFKSPYYNLVQNDLIIVGTTGQLQKEAEQVRVTQKISFGLTLVTVAATLANIFIRRN